MHTRRSKRRKERSVQRKELPDVLLEPSTVHESVQRWHANAGDNMGERTNVSMQAQMSKAEKTRVVAAGGVVIHAMDIPQRQRGQGRQSTEEVRPLLASDTWDVEGAPNMKVSYERVMDRAGTGESEGVAGLAIKKLNVIRIQNVPREKPQSGHGRCGEGPMKPGRDVRNVAMNVEVDASIGVKSDEV
ncbi:hypothetical protein K438DRAFT_1770449 [Mycena galopus ATCC 62051]|nr:hypothetical protein K438DRAFT_1770449 [Mycena galopus ATCC 62051]